MKILLRRNEKELRVPRVLVGGWSPKMDLRVAMRGSQDFCNRFSDARSQDIWCANVTYEVAIVVLPQITAGNVEGIVSAHKLLLKT